MYPKELGGVIYESKRDDEKSFTMLMCLIMVFSIAACSERVPDELDSD